MLTTTTPVVKGPTYPTPEQASGTQAIDRSLKIF
jgi:hypothetical protein